MRDGQKKFWEKYRHGALLIAYAIIYLVWFFYLEGKNFGRLQVIHMTPDDYIPFCEVFVVPYLLWYIYCSAVILFFLFKNKTEYYKNCLFLFTGMTLFLIISTLWPNVHHLRPAVMPRDNLFTFLISLLYRADTPTNLWPSIHVYNSLGAHFAIIHSGEFEGKRWIHTGSLILSSLIIASTMFIKQHSLFDVLTAFALAAVMYVAVYRYDVIDSAKIFLKRRYA